MILGEQDLDGISPAAHEAWLVNALRKQIGYMRPAVPYWSQRLSSARVDEEKVESLADLAALPIFTRPSFVRSRRWSWFPRRRARTSQLAGGRAVPRVGR